MVAVAAAHSTVPVGCHTGVAAFARREFVEAVHTGVAHKVAAVVDHTVVVRRMAVVVARKVVEVDHKVVVQMAAVGHKVVVPAESGLDRCTWISPPNL